MKTAVLGMGRMGAALAGRLLAGGHEVVVWNRSPGKATDVVKAGAVEAGSLADAVKAAEVVLTCLSDDAAVRHVALGDGGVQGSIADGVPYIECSTVSPQLTDELAGMFDNFAAMPVLGGPAAVESGQATYLVGTGPHTLELIEPVLAALGGAVRHYGMAGLASTAKLTVNLMLLAGVAALAESFTVGRSGGLRRRPAARAPRGSGGAGPEEPLRGSPGGPGGGLVDDGTGGQGRRLGHRRGRRCGRALAGGPGCPPRLPPGS